MEIRAKRMSGNVTGSRTEPNESTRNDAAAETVSLERSILIDLGIERQQDPTVILPSICF